MKRKRFFEKLVRPWAAYTFAACAAVFFYVFLTHLHVVGAALSTFYYYIQPVFVGLIVAYMLDPLVKFFENRLFGKMKRRHSARGISVTVTFLLLILLFTFFLIALIPQLISSTRLFISNLSTYGSGLNTMLGNLTEFAAEHGVDISNYTSAGTDLVGMITSRLPASVNGILNTTISYGVEVFNGVIACIIAIYLLMDKTRLLDGANRFFRALFSDKNYRQSNNFVGRVNSIMIQYILCDLLDGLIVGVANAVFMLIVGYPYVPLISVVAGTTNLAPTFGPILGTVIGCFILFLVNPWYALGFLLFTLALQTADGYIIKPRLFGETLGVPSIWILIAIIVGGRVFGIIGILLAIPFAAIFDFLYRDEILVRLEEYRARRDGAIAAAKAATGEETDENWESASLDADDEER